MKLEKMAHAEDSRHGWYTYWLIVLKKPPFGAGMAGFKGFPDERGEAEIGYGIDPAYEHRGIMTETVKALLAWAFSEPACRSVVARDVLKGNLPSQRVLIKAGFTVYREDSNTLDYRIDRDIPSQRS